MANTNEENKLINLRPIVIACCFLVIGIFCAFYSFKISKLFSIIAFALFFCLFAIMAFLKVSFKRKLIIFSIICLCFFLLGHFLTDLRINKVKNLSVKVESETFVGRVCEVTYYDSGVYVEFDNCKFRSYDIEGKTSAFIYDDYLIDKIDIGAILQCNATICNKYYLGEIESDIFGGLYYELKDISQIEVVGVKVNFYEVIFLKARSFLRTHLSEKSYSTAIALTLGNTSFLPRTVLQEYRFAGIAHIFAVSGLHIGVFISIFTFLASKLNVKKIFKILIILVPAFIYCGVCGFRPSSLRAFIMALITVIANYIGFKRDNLSAVALAGIILLIINPMNLFEVGFKLSFLAVSAIFIINPVFERGSSIFKSVGNPLSVSLSAQLATLPVLTDMSGYISIISIFANLIFVPVAVALYLITLLFFILSAFLSMFADSIAQFLMLAPDYLLKACNFLILKIDYSIWAIPATFSLYKIPWYLGLACLSDTLNLTWKQKLITSLITIAVTFGGIALSATL